MTHESHCVVMRVETVAGRRVWSAIGAMEPMPYYEAVRRALALQGRFPHGEFVVIGEIARIGVTQTVVVERRDAAPLAFDRRRTAR